MRFRVLLLLVALPAVSGFLPRAGSEEITLEQYLERVRTRHPYFAKQDYNPRIARKEGESLLGGQEWVFRLSPYYNRYGEVTASPAQGVHNTGGELALSKSVWETGGQIDLSFRSDYTRAEGAESFDVTTFQRTVRDTDTFTQTLSVTYVQPLLKNLGGTLQRLGWGLNQYDVEISRVNAEENKEAFLLSVAQKFLEWAHLDEQMRLSRARLELARQQLEQTNRRYQANLVDRVDVIRAEDAVRQAEQGLIQLESRWQAAQAELAVLSASQELYEATPRYDLYSLESLPPAEEALSRLKRGARVLQPLAIAQDQLRRNLEGLEEKRRPELNLTLTGSLLGSDEEFAESLKLQHPDFRVDLDLLVPTGYREETARMEKTELQIRQLEESVGDLEVTLESSLRNLLIRLENTERILELGRELIRSAEERTGEELRLYNQGRGQLNFVIQARDNEANARLSQAEAAAGYQRLLLQYRELMDELYPGGNTDG